ncbi:adenylate cyclase-like protein [Dentipellis sp. KUC8613]|nr:adenylate cyclase-like protein [Dentipellis sp. KUC8613]
MEGVVDPSVLSHVSEKELPKKLAPRPAPRTDLVEGSVLSLAYPGTVTYYPLFSWSGPPNPTRDKRSRSISYATPAVEVPHRLNEFTNATQSSLWNPPDSWAVDGKEDTPADVDYSSSEENSSLLPKPLRSDSATTASQKTWRRQTYRREVPRYPVGVYPDGVDAFTMRIYRGDGTFELLDIPLSANVTDLAPMFNERLVRKADTVKHRLYLIECGRERLVAKTERPANILWLRLQLVGFEPSDPVSNFTYLDLSCTATFTWKSVALGNLPQEVSIKDFKNIDMSHQRLRAIPTALYRHAEEITQLSLSSNPMLNIPVDFAQACTALRELSIASMFIKRVPNGVHHFPQLEVLDLSSNRIGDLEDAGLENIPTLARLNLTNHRLETLPQSWAKMRALRVLNVSNGKFDKFPDVICKIHSLQELDISFNGIHKLPDAIGELRKLKRLYLVCNRLTRFPATFSNMASLRTLDCKHNVIVDMAPVLNLESLSELHFEHNSLEMIHLPFGPSLAALDLSNNPLNCIFIHEGPFTSHLRSLTSLDLSHANLTSVDTLPFRLFTSLEQLQLAYNELESLPNNIGDLDHLTFLSCCHNRLTSLPNSIGRMTRLNIFNARNNRLTEIPAAIWNCGSLMTLNLTGNLIETWNPPLASSVEDLRKMSALSLWNSQPSRTIIPLVQSLKKLYLGQNKLTDDVIALLAILKNLELLNISFNDIVEIPGHFFRDLRKLDELYLSGNKLKTFAGEDLYHLRRLHVLFLNGNNLHTLPAELMKLSDLTMLDVGSNELRYNINNWEFDWNWNFNARIQYLNLSGNKQLEIKPDYETDRSLGNIALSKFSSLPLRVLGLIDVTTTFVTDIPEDTCERRVRTSASDVNGLVYGIADYPGARDHSCMLDLVKPKFRGQNDEALFALFGRTHPNTGDIIIARHLNDNFLPVFEEQMDELEDPPTAFRRTFLRLSKGCYDHVQSLRNPDLKDPEKPRSPNVEGVDLMKIGVAGVAVYLKGKTLYVANAGNAMAVVSRGGSAHLLSTKHDPFDRREFARIRAAEGWVDSSGFIGGVVRVSRTFGFFGLTPIVNPCPDIHTYEVTEADEFVIIANAGLWDNVSVQVAVDIASSEAGDPMLAAQKLRDFAMSYGGEAAVMVMVVSLSRLFEEAPMSGTFEGSLFDSMTSTLRDRKESAVSSSSTVQLSHGVAPPMGHLALVFTDICNSTHLWETNRGMGTAIRLHHALLRRQLSLCGGYEVKTEGDAFMVAFQTVAEALLWCLTVQMELLYLNWPEELLACEEGMAVYNAEGKLISRGLAVRMGMHCGTPVCGPDAVTKRMDYFGPMVNRAVRICACAEGGQILLSAGAVTEIQARERAAKMSASPDPVIKAISGFDAVIALVGETKLKNLEVPEILASVSPRQLVGRKTTDVTIVVDDSAERSALCSSEELHQLSSLCIRIEAIAGRRMIKPCPLSAVDVIKFDCSDEDSGYDSDPFLHGDLTAMLPALPDNPSVAELLVILDFLLIRLENALQAVENNLRDTQSASVMDALRSREGRSISPLVMQQILDLLNE